MSANLSVRNRVIVREREREGPKKSVRDQVIVRESEIARERAKATEWWRGIARKSERVRVIDRSIGAGGPPSSRRCVSFSFGRGAVAPPTSPPRAPTSTLIGRFI